LALRWLTLVRAPPPGLMLMLRRTAGSKRPGPG
jgi:hypothetical protein